MIRTRRANARGLTLIELLVVIAIVIALAAGTVAGSQQLPSARLKRSAAMLAAAVKVAYTRATTNSRYERLVFDFDQEKVWLEETDRPMLVQSNTLSAAAGADPVSDAEKAAIAESERILKGPPVPKPHFHPVQALGFGDAETGKGGKPLQRGIKFRQVQTIHDDAARTTGRAYLYFWPGGLTERAVIQIRVGESEEEHSTLTLVVMPLTGKVTVKTGPVELEKPDTDQDQSERDDKGGSP
jgi:general secretion pathway protein H